MLPRLLILLQALILALPTTAAEVRDGVERQFAAMVDEILRRRALAERGESPS